MNAIADDQSKSVDNCLMSISEETSSNSIPSSPLKIDLTSEKSFSQASDESVLIVAKKLFSKKTKALSKNKSSNKSILNSSSNTSKNVIKTRSKRLLEATNESKPIDIQSDEPEDEFPCISENPDPESEQESEEMADADFEFNDSTLLTYIQNYIRKWAYLTYQEKVDLRNRKDEKARGRPLKKFDGTDKGLLELVNHWFTNIIEIAKGIRIDSEFITVVRKLKDIPQACLEYIGRKSAYKNRNLEIYTTGFLESFVNIFIPLYQLQNRSVHELTDLFLEYIMLKFPIKKVKVIYNTLIKEGVTSFNLKHKIKDLTEARKKTTKDYYQKFLERNE